MEIKQHALAGVIEFVPRVFRDARGVFFESFSAQLMEQAGVRHEWVQDNQSSSSHNVLRGLHFQRPPHAQAKLVRVAQGRAQDVVVDMRRNSATFGQHLLVELDAERGNLLYVPIGFAHGFVTLEANTLFLYKCSEYYHPTAEGGIRWDDPALNINWGVEVPLVSDKDQALPLLREFESPF